ncbi:MAG: pirin family protein [Actinomycetes bacterium]
MQAGSVEVRRSGSRFVTVAPGLLSRHSFSFGAHYQPDNVAYGPLLVSNEDLLDVGSGYDTHPHRDAEILTWVLAGSLRHQDSHGNTGLVYPGLAQRLSAGSGIRHSERNDGFTLDPGRVAEPVHFIQMWLRPDVAGTTPGYASRELDSRDLAAAWVPVASGGDRDAAISLGTAAASLYVTRLSRDDRRTLPDAPRLHLQVGRGAVDLEGSGTVEAGDTVRIRGGGGQRLRALTAAEVLVWTFGS